MKLTFARINDLTDPKYGDWVVSKGDPTCDLEEHPVTPELVQCWFGQERAPTYTYLELPRTAELGQLQYKLRLTFRDAQLHAAALTFDPTWEISGGIKINRFVLEGDYTWPTK
jgi:hypothetical protein